LTSKFTQTLTKTWQAEKTAIGRFQKRTSREPSAYTKDYGFPTDYKEFNKMIGYPINRNTNKPSPMTPYQIEYHNAIQKHHKVIVNKSRKIGITEAAIRSIALNIFHIYAGHDIMIIAGNELKIAKEILLRLYELFKDKPKLGYAFKHNGIKWKESDLIHRVSINGQHPIIEFRNGTRVFCFAASRSGKSQSFRGPDDVISILFSEAAHTGMIEDQPIMNALEPNLANRDDADFILESTPNGKRGFLYNYWMDIKEGKMKGWHQIEWDYHHGLKCGVLSKKFLAQQKANPRIDFFQEYCCKFTSTVSGIFKDEDISLLPDDAPEPVDLLKAIGRNYDTKTEDEAFEE
jgi:hypothetical protein